MKTPAQLTAAGRRLGPLDQTSPSFLVVADGFLVLSYLARSSPEADFLNKLLGTTLLVHSSAGTVTEVGLIFFELLRVQTLPCLSH